MLLDDRRRAAIVHAALDHRPERLPRPARPDDARDRRDRTSPSAARANLATHVRRGGRRPARHGLLLAAGDNVGASPPNSALLEDMPAIDVENAWGLRRHLLRQPRVRLRRRAAARAPGARQLPVPGDEHRRDRHRAGARLGQARRSSSTSTACKVGVIGAELENTPELVSAGATAGPDVPRRGRRASRPSPSGCAALGVKVQIVVIHEGADHGANTVDGAAGRPWDGPIVDIADQLAGHDGRRDRSPATPTASPT